MIINYNNKDITIPKPVDQCFFGSNPQKEMTIHNRFNDEHHQQSAKNHLHPHFLSSSAGHAHEYHATVY